MPPLASLRVVHSVASLSADHGGPSRSVTALAGAQVSLGLDVRIVTMRVDSEGAPVAAPGGVSLTVVPRPRHDLRLLVPGSGFGQALGAELRGTPIRVILHDHGLWLPSNHLAARVARRLRTPRVVSNRGMLSSWALEQSAFRKQVAWQLFQKRDLLRAQLIHVTSNEEKRDLEKQNIYGDVVTIPNGVSIPQQRPAASDVTVKTALFLSRIHQKKGLENLLAAWSEVHPAGWRLVIAGPGEEAYVASLQRQVAALGLVEFVSFVGPVADYAKWDLYRSADLFVLPTHSENFGLVVAEALAAGVPVITTHGAPWQELETERCGWWIPIGAEPLSVALKEATTLSRDALRGMGARGRALVERKYTWDRVAQQMVEAYDRVLAAAEVTGG